MKPSKIEKVACFALVRLISPLRPRWGTILQLFFFERWGMKLKGRPNYISSKVAVDGTGYDLITLGEGVTISSYVRILTHDWSPHTVGKALGIFTPKPLGRISSVEIGDFSFIGTGSIVMPGARIGRGCIIGAGTVARGEIPDFSIVIGSPGKIIGDTRDYFRKHFPEHF